eukprot:TRINITY_DN6411_c0_g2_i1.p1 TRINITY_DN6411_c0_g2~~TRINITY_DN6411_c0_g2_i1.p1  ORF type:complete len:209 (-),score=35.51 TRINITY_DN6411_c0_g2_i1:25-651(-)
MSQLPIFDKINSLPTRPAWWDQMKQAYPTWTKLERDAANGKKMIAMFNDDSRAYDVWLVNQNYARVDSSNIISLPYNVAAIPQLSAFKFYGTSVSVFEDNKSTTTILRLYTKKDSSPYSSTSYLHKTGMRVRNLVKKMVKGLGYIRLLVTLPRSLSEMKGAPGPQSYIETVDGVETLVIEVSLSNLKDLFADTTVKVLESFYSNSLEE